MLNKSIFSPTDVRSSVTNDKKVWNSSFLMNIAKQAQPKKSLMISISQINTADRRLYTTTDIKHYTKKPPPSSAGSSGLEDKTTACSSIKPSF